MKDALAEPHLTRRSDHDTVCALQRGGEELAFEMCDKHSLGLMKGGRAATDGSAVLCVAEVAFPGAFLLWIGMAAIATGIVDFFVPFNGTWGLILFAGFAFAFMLLGQKVYGAAAKKEPDAGLNNRSGSPTRGRHSRRRSYRRW